MTNSFLMNTRSFAKASHDENLKAYNQNDFDLALTDYALLKNPDRYKINLENLNWFQIDSPGIYASHSLDAYASYLTYAILKNFFYRKEIIKLDMEKYFTNQLIGHIQSKAVVDTAALENVLKYYKKVDKLVDVYIKIFGRYSELNSTQSCYFTCDKDQYRIDIPMVAYTSKSTVDIFLVLPYFGKKPNWFTIPSIYKMYRYYAELDTLVLNLHITWLNLFSYFTEPITETIKFTENVARMVGMYSDIVPYQFENIFSNTNKKRYGLVPLSTITKDYL